MNKVSMWLITRFPALKLNTDINKNLDTNTKDY